MRPDHTFAAAIMNSLLESQDRKAYKDSLEFGLVCGVLHAGTIGPGNTHPKQQNGMWR